MTALFQHRDTLTAALNKLGVLPRAKPKPKPATGPIRVVTGEPDF